jgi:hypothetical protein
VHTDSDLQNVALEEGLRSFAKEEWRIAVHEIPDIKTDNSQARVHIIETAITVDDDVLALRNRLFTLYSVERDLVVVTTQDQNFVDEVGLTLHFQSDLLDIDKDMMVVKVEERITQRQTELTLWG